MEMKEKYYTPSIEEFHVGFEYEIFNFEQGWIKAYLNDDMYLDGISKVLLSMKRCLIAGILFEIPGSIRVKHLDKEDIESFGFIFEALSSEYGNSDEYKIKLRGFEEVSLKLQRSDYSKVKIVSADTGFIIDGPNYSTKFNGTIKNKSEFSRLLKQLSII